MARLARTVVPDLPHHVTQRGNGRQQVFFSEEDYAFYRDLLAEHCRAATVQVWAWVLMPNHVHLILTPAESDGLRRALAQVHRRYAGHIHAREGRSGHFWQGRFGAVAMDEAHLSAAIRYVLQNPVRARLVSRAEDWAWSSVHAHLSGDAGGVTTLAPVADRFPDIRGLIDADPDMHGDAAAQDRLRRAESIGRPLGDAPFLKRLESQLGRRLAPQPRGRKPRSADDLTEGNRRKERQ